MSNRNWKGGKRLRNIGKEMTQPRAGGIPTETNQRRTGRHRRAQPGGIRRRGGDDQWRSPRWVGPFRSCSLFEPVILYYIGLLSAALVQLLPGPGLTCVVVRPLIRTRTTLSFFSRARGNIQMTKTQLASCYWIETELIKPLSVRIFFLKKNLLADLMSGHQRGYMVCVCVCNVLMVEHNMWLLWRCSGLWPWRLFWTHQRTSTTTKLQNCHSHPQRWVRVIKWSCPDMWLASSRPSSVDVDNLTIKSSEVVSEDTKLSLWCFACYARVRRLWSTRTTAITPKMFLLFQSCLHLRPV